MSGRKWYRRTNGVWLAVATASVILTLAGCSGAGAPAQNVAGDTAQQTATLQMTALQLLRGWLQILYPPPATSTMSVEVDQVNETTWRARGTDSWGHPFEYYSRADGSGWGHWYTAPEMEVHGVWTKDEEIAPSVLRKHVHYRYPGMDLVFVVTADYSGGGFAPTVQEGTEKLSDGRMLDFRYETIPEVEETVSLKLRGDGPEVFVRVPIDFVVDVGFRPRPGQPATGTAKQGGGGLQLAFSGNDGVWSQLETSSPGGLTGSFQLGDHMTGSGQMRQGAEVFGALNWPESLLGRLQLVSTQNFEVSPMAAARDLSIERWLARASGLGPASVF